MRYPTNIVVNLIENHLKLQYLRQVAGNICCYIPPFDKYVIIMKTNHYYDTHVCVYIVYEYHHYDITYASVLTYTVHCTVYSVQCIVYSV